MTVNIDDIYERIRLQQPGARCGSCSVAALCGNAGHREFERWFRENLLLHVHCPVCDRHGAFSVRTGREVFPAPDSCPVVLLRYRRQTIYTKMCIPCFRGQQIQHGGIVEPEFEEEDDGQKEMGERRRVGAGNGRD